MAKISSQRSRMSRAKTSRSSLYNILIAARRESCVRAIIFRGWHIHTLYKLSAWTRIEPHRRGIVTTGAVWQWTRRVREKERKRKKYARDASWTQVCLASRRLGAVRLPSPSLSVLFLFLWLRLKIKRLYSVALRKCIQYTFMKVIIIGMSFWRDISFSVSSRSRNSRNHVLVLSWIKTRSKQEIGNWFQNKTRNYYQDFLTISQEISWISWTFLNFCFYF